MFMQLLSIAASQLDWNCKSMSEGDEVRWIVTIAAVLGVEKPRGSIEGAIRESNVLLHTVVH